MIQHLIIFLQFYFSVSSSKVEDPWGYELYACISTLPIYNIAIQTVCNKLFSVNQVLEYHLFGKFK